MDLKALHKITYGLYIVSSRDQERLNGQIANTVFQVTATPPRVAVCLNRENLTHSFVNKSGIFSISVLEQETPFKFIGIFGFHSGRDIDKFKGIKYKIGKTGVPIVLEHTLAYMEFKVEGKMETGTHTLFIGTLRGAEIIKEGTPLTYDYYHRVLKGKSPKNAPTYIEERRAK